MPGLLPPRWLEPAAQMQTEQERSPGLVLSLNGSLPSWECVGWALTAPLEGQGQDKGRPRGPGTGQGQVHLCHSSDLCTNVTFSQKPSLAT